MMMSEKSAIQEVFEQLEFGEAEGGVRWWKWARVPEIDDLKKALREIYHLQEIEQAAKHAEAVLRKASKEPPQNGWIETAPQYFEWLADSLKAALERKP